MNLPQWFKTAKFWEAVSMIVAGALALGAFFGKLDPSWAVPWTVVFAWVSGLLKMFGIQLELRLRAVVEKQEKLLARYEERIMVAESKSKGKK